VNPTRAYDDFAGLLSDLEGTPAVWEKQNLFLALYYRPRSEIPAGLEALAELLKKSPGEISAQFQAFQAETERMRKAKR
jgi:hypothetical protein